MRGEAHAPGDATVLLCNFRGLIRKGSSGNSQVEQMESIISSAIASGEFKSIVLDLTEVRYSFGDHAFGLLINLRHRGLALVLIQSERCRQLGGFAELVGGWSICDSRESAS